MSYDAHCCIVGGGPAGMVLALLLGRAGIPTAILEEHLDFERDFRGDTVHPSTMELMDALGLADRLLALPHSRIQRVALDTPNGSVVMADLSRLRSKFPYITMMPQARFLDVLAEELARLPSVRLIMGAAVQGLLWDDPWGFSGVADRAPELSVPGSHPSAPAPARGREGDGAAPPSSQEGEAGQASGSRGAPAARAADFARTLPKDATVRGVRYRTREGQHDLRAPLTVGADGRFSRLRRLAGFELQRSAPPMDVIWFRLPRYPTDELEDGRFTVGHGHLLIALNRGDQWQIAYVIPKGGYREIRDAGLPAFRQSVAALMPLFAGRVEQLQDWHQASLLSVEAGRVRRWYRPGLLLIGDAAHVMSPVAGVGINYAIQDAVVAANVLTEPLRHGRLRLRDLAAVQRQREIPTRIIQAFQRAVQERVIGRVLAADASIQPPPILQLPLLRDVLPRLIGYGVWPVRLTSAILKSE